MWSRRAQVSAFPSRSSVTLCLRSVVLGLVLQARALAMPSTFLFEPRRSERGVIVQVLIYCRVLWYLILKNVGHISSEVPSRSLRRKRPSQNEACPPFYDHEAFSFDTGSMLPLLPRDGTTRCRVLHGRRVDVDVG